VVNNYNGISARIPDFMIVGAARSGTTSIYLYLKQHPQIFMPRRKEPFYFSLADRPPNSSDPVFNNNKVWRYSDYVQLFEPASDTQLIGEASTSYLYTYRPTIEHIKKVYGEKYTLLKIIIILRNPVDRAFSNYLLLRRNNREELPFQKALDKSVIEKRKEIRWGYDYIGFGMYYKQVKAYLKEFPHIKILLFEDLQTDKNFLNGLFEFLGVRRDIPVDLRINANKSGIPKNRFLNTILLNSKFFKNIMQHFASEKNKIRLIKFREQLMSMNLKKVTIDGVLKEQLATVFREDILKLQDLINRDLTSWLD